MGVTTLGSRVDCEILGSFPGTPIINVEVALLLNVMDCVHVPSPELIFPN
jgi:hypothetical protein